MTLSPETGFSRRSFVRRLATSIGALSLPMLTEGRFSAQWRGRDKASGPPAVGGVYLDANENPLGPSTAATRCGKKCRRRWRTIFSVSQRRVGQNVCCSEGLDPEYVIAYPGSGEPLSYAILSYTSPQRGLVTAIPVTNPPSAQRKRLVPRLRRWGLLPLTNMMQRP